MTVRRMVEEPLLLHTGLGRAERRERAEDVLQHVGLGLELADRYPHELSGGQRQRTNIARAIVTRPRLVVLDEPTSALDVSLRSRVILLLERLREELDLAYLFISHDIATVKYLAGRIAVMYLGVIVEQGSAAEVIGNPLHPYTRALVSAVPIPDPDRRRARFVLRGEPPGSASVVEGCRLRGRCPLAVAVCAQPVPLREVSPGRLVACHLV
jgi:oligopeptide/dipeptide ABC transporter ATP-binding protein